LVATVTGTWRVCESEVVAELKLRTLRRELQVEVAEEASGPPFHRQLIQQALGLKEVVSGIKRRVLRTQRGHLLAKGQDRVEQYSLTT